MTYQQQAILRTVLYSDLFAFPLAKEELWKFLITRRPLSKKGFEKVLQDGIPHVITKDGLYCLSGSEASLSKREEHRELFLQKMHAANTIAQKLSYIPTILFIGVSGSLAVGDARPQDDIDFFIITKKETLYSTRLIILSLLEAYGLRRRAGEQTAPDKVCVNLLIDETHLHWEKAKQNLYTAHEIAQVRPLFERENIFRRFLAANDWIHTFLPNSTQELLPIVGRIWRREYLVLHVLQSLLSKGLIINVSKALQLRTIRKHHTHEIVTKHKLAFHPYNYETHILRNFREKCEKVGLLTKF
ncbi:MAG: nucleotidyltransferase domain-containing protein [Patescibacteria group bacterium]